MKNGRFEMSILSAVNKAFLDDGNAPYDGEMKEIAEKVVSIYEEDSF